MLPESNISSALRHYGWKYAKSESSRRYKFPIVNSCYSWQINAWIFQSRFPGEMRRNFMYFYLSIQLKKYLFCFWSRLQIEFRKWLNFMPNCGMNLKDVSNIKFLRIVSKKKEGISWPARIYWGYYVKAFYPLAHLKMTDSLLTQINKLGDWKCCQE